MLKSFKSIAFFCRLLPRKKMFLGYEEKYFYNETNLIIGVCEARTTLILINCLMLFLLLMIAVRNLYLGSYGYLMVCLIFEVMLL